MEPTPQRRIVQAEALGWLAANPAEVGTSVITSLPDVSEIADFSFEEWRAWFVEAAAHVLRWVPEDGLAMFYQSDIRHAGQWIDKSYLVQRAAEGTPQRLLFHKIVCRKPAGTLGFGRASYSHLLAFGGPALSHGEMARVASGPDVLPDAGTMSFSRAMGLEAARLACAYLRDATKTRIVVDPFCGQGGVLAMANSMGFDAVGVDLNGRRCRAARKLMIPA